MREFRVHYDTFRERGIEVAGVSLDSPPSARAWAKRLGLPYPLLSDSERQAGPAFGVVRRVGLGAFSIEYFRRSTFLIDARGIVVAVWGQVKIRGHALDVLDVARALSPRAAGA